MKLYIASDHGGFELKGRLVEWLRSNGYEVEDLGPYRLDPHDDYPDAGFTLGEAIAASPGSLGIALCRNGQGICVAANKVPGIRAVTGLTPEQAVTTRHDDDANVLCVAAEYQSIQQIMPILEAWLGASASDDDRHVRRRAKITAYEHSRNQQ